MPTAAAPPRPRRKRPASKPGPEPVIMRGWMPKALRWRDKSPAGLVLHHLARGATWDHAARQARMNPSTIHRWNVRGTEALGEHDDVVFALDATRDPETRAYLVFYVEAEAARGEPVVNALGQIVQAGSTEWRAAAHVLRVLPQASDYREKTRHELTGEDGGPLSIDVTAAAERAILDLAEQFAGDDAARDT